MLVRRPAKSGRRRPMAERLRRPPRGAAADLRDHRQHHLQRRDRVRTCRLGFDDDDKLHGTAEIEQVWIDFKIIDQFNWRAPGIDLVPIGYINQHHEPTQFYSVLRPELYNGLIPSTWKAPATSVYGTIADGLSYQLQASMASRISATISISAPTPTPFRRFRPAMLPASTASTRSRFSQPAGWRFPPAQQHDRGRRQSRLSRRRSWPGFAGSISAYFTPNIDAARRLCRLRQPRSADRAWRCSTPNSATAFRTRARTPRRVACS